MNQCATCTVDEETMKIIHAVKDGPDDLKSILIKHILSDHQNALTAELYGYMQAIAEIGHSKGKQAGAEFLLKVKQAYEEIVGKNTKDLPPLHERDFSGLIYHPKYGLVSKEFRATLTEEQLKPETEKEVDKRLPKYLTFDWVAMGMYDKVIYG